VGFLLVVHSFEVSKSFALTLLTCMAQTASNEKICKAIAVERDLTSIVSFEPMTALSQVWGGN
jgi:hypothetical protein